MDFDPARALARAKEDFTPERVLSGQEYCRALISLGLDPDILCWVYETNRDETHLALVTSLVDRIESVKIYDVLFKAYDMSVTPRSVDPFIVSLYSPNMDMAVDLINSLSRVDGNGWVDFGPAHVPPHVSTTLFNIGIAENKIIFGSGIFRVNTRRANADQDRGRWAKVTQRVDALAA